MIDNKSKSKTEDVIVFVILFFFVLFLAALYFNESKTWYIETDEGLIRKKFRSCEMGLVHSESGSNLLDKNGSPLRCSGTINLTSEQYKKYEGGL